MKKILILGLGALLALTGLGVSGMLLFRHFVTDQITDRGGMENPDAGPEQEQMLDGDGSYAANEILLEQITGIWESADGRWEMALDRNSGIVVSKNGTTVLEDTLEFTYLRPGEGVHTEFELQSGNDTLRSTDDGTVYQIFSIYYEAVKDDVQGELCMELIDGGDNRKVIRFPQHRTQ